MIIAACVTVVFPKFSVGFLDQQRLRSSVSRIASVAEYAHQRAICTHLTHLLHFNIEEGKYWVIDKIKDRVKFKRHNLLSDPYEENCDLILCRNVVIYFTDAAKSKINRGFHNSLREGGILFIGGREIIFDASPIVFGVAMPSFYRRVSEGTLNKSGKTGFKN